MKSQVIIYILFYCIIIINYDCNSTKESNGIHTNSLFQRIQSNFILYNNPNNEEQSVLKLELDLKPANQKKEYSIYLKDKAIYLEYSFNNDKKFQKKINESFFSPEILEFDKKEYINNCIEDGENIMLKIPKDSREYRTIKFQNQYNQKLDSIISLINSEIAESYKIYYNKEQLNSLPQNCN